MLYGKGIIITHIEEQIREVYNFEVSTSTIYRITEKVTEDIVAWQNRPLEPVYFCWKYGIFFKVRENSKVINKTIYIARASPEWEERSIDRGFSWQK